MSERASRYLGFFAMSAAMYALIVEGFDILARIQVGGQSFAHAVSETVHYSLTQPIGSLISFAPFAAISWICASLARVSRNRALGLMVACLLPIALMYYEGYADSQEYMSQRMWTAATLAVGLIPFKSIPIVLIALIFRLLLGRTNVPTKA